MRTMWLVCIILFVLILIVACYVITRGNKARQNLAAQTKTSVDDIIKLLDTDINDIWDIQDQNSFIIAMNGWLCKKCNYGDDIEKLSHAERVIFIIIQLENEVNNGGFLQYWYNSSGKFANEIVEALREIGAYKTADICATALSELGNEVTEDLELQLESMTTDSVNEILSECESKFYSYPDNLEELNYKFIIENRSQFTRN